MSECERTNCGYYYKGEDDDYPCCHCEDDDVASCEYDEPADIDDDCGFDPYEGCCTYDC